MILKKASKKAIDYACKHFHYSKSVPVNTFGYAVFNDAMMNGLVLFFMVQVQIITLLNLTD